MKTIHPLWLLVLSLLVPQPASACTIPVFRYALERWDLGTYDVLVYHRGPLPAELKAALKKWSDAPNRANIDITTLDLDGKLTPWQQELWNREGKPEATAWMLVRPPGAGPKEPSAWTGPCSVERLQGVIDSPLRQAMVAHLTRGASIVFVLMTGKDDKLNEAKFALLKKHLPILQRGIKLPVQSDDGPKILLPLPLQVSFPLLVLDRDDPKEASLVRLLLATEEGLDRENGPILFPIFGRGRVFPCLYGEHFTDEILYKATEFLCKDCSCQIKKLSPGVDLLVEADWPRIFDGLFEEKQLTAAPAGMFTLEQAPAHGGLSPIHLVPMPTGMFQTLPKQQRQGTAPGEPVPVKTVTPPAAAAPATPAAPAAPAGSTIVLLTTEAELLPPSVARPESQACCPLETRSLLWIATAVAAALVVLTGGWALSSLRK
jgi:hypothetical protein